MTFNEMLKEKNIDPAEVLVLRHRPQERVLNKALPLLAESRPDLFNAYQQTQTPRVEKAMSKAKYVASFIARKSNRAMFIGLYRMNGGTSITRQDCMLKPESKALLSYGMKDHTDNPKHKQSYTWFDLSLEDTFFPHWKGKLIVDWPAPSIVWARWAKNARLPFRAILNESALLPPMPTWNNFILTHAGLKDLPLRWQVALSAWKGIYYIHDTFDGRGYVGSAKGEENILGRWRAYAASGHGGNKLLKACNPENFEYSILQVMHDADEGTIEKLETTWKKRLHTRGPHGLNAN